jgi:molybdenum cofactor biosynthesis enzyme MoaA/polysaccharide pyruvyl transferase WcaK-like protein
LKSAARGARQVWRIGWHQLRRDVFGSILPMKPTAISFMANDICNSKCVMCLIWKQKKDKEITADEFRQILDEPLFSNVKHIGVTGGEPTLRKDLPELFEALAARKPKLDGASIITNAIRSTEVRERVLTCAAVCAKHNVGFGVMVSLDGVGETHDANRGRPGNFDSAIECIESFRAAGLQTSVGCTVTKGNVAEVDNLLDWTLDRGIAARFRVAEFITRLYNDPQSDHIRNFTDREAHHLGLFYSRIAKHEPSSAIRKTYASVQGMVADGKKRATGCPYHHDAVILTSRGELLYCSPKSPNLGPILERGSAAKVYFGNLGKRSEIREKHCDDCIHDYHVSVTFTEQVRFKLAGWRRRRVYDLARLHRDATSLTAKPCDAHDQLQCDSVLIIGWYGTETIGDKAILHSLVQRLRSRAHPPRRIVLSSFFPWYSRYTLRELGIKDIEIVETWTPDFESMCCSVDEIVIGGGPLMELQSLDQMLFAFITAARRGVIARIDGCGIGPVSSPLYISIIADLVRLASHVTLRDAKAVEWCKTHAPSAAPTVIEDPAADFVRGVASGALQLPSPDYFSHDVIGPPDGIACFLRDWPTEYRGSIPAADFPEVKASFERELIAFLTAVSNELRTIPRLLPMNCFSEGGDDRVFARRLQKQNPTISTPQFPASPWEIIAAMRQARLCVCMRYHSVVFAHTLGVPFIAIDYTNEGKISGYLRERGLGGQLISTHDIASGRWREAAENLKTMAI